VAIRIREATEDELDEAGRVTAEAYRALIRPGHDADWESYLERIADVRDRASRTVIMVAVDDGQVIGSATLELQARTDADDDPLDERRAHIRMLGIRPDAQGQGAGRALMEACEARAAEAGKTVMTLNTTRRMTAAQRMYERLGYERQPDRVFPDGFVLLSYAKRLSPSTI
jgi:ribosomal protein S18 acetylase RimI-like enzyme